MGSGASARFSFWNAREVEENETSLEHQKRACDFLTRYLFLGVPVRKTKKSADPKSPVWLETHPDILSDAINKNPEDCEYNQDLLRALPTGVLIDSKGKIKVYFTLYTASEVVYDLTVQDIMNVEQAHFLNVNGKFKNYSLPLPYSNNFATRHEVNLYHVAPIPAPPVLVCSTHDSLTLSMLTSIPQPVGIVQCVEIQYSHVSTGCTTVPMGSISAISSISKRAHKRQFIAAYISQQRLLRIAEEQKDREKIEALIRRYHAEKAEEDMRFEKQRQRLLEERDREHSGGYARRAGNDDVREKEKSISIPHQPVSPIHTSASLEEPLHPPEDLIHDSSLAGLEDDRLSQPAQSPFRWYSLVTRGYQNSDFASHTFDRLQPGDGFIFRLRYRNHLSFSPYSAPTQLVFTKAAAPSVPETPVLGVLTPTSVMLFWQPPQRDNGSSITHYLLRARSVGADWVVLFEGTGCSFLAADLFPDFAYSFQVAARNGVGVSEYSDALSVQTPARQRSELDLMNKADSLPYLQAIANPLSMEYRAAMRCTMAWRELWDPAGQRVFYFNRITSVRQLERPDCFGPALESEQENENEDSKFGPGPASAADKARQREAEFRKKRYNLMRALHKENNKGRGSVVGSTSSPSKGGTFLVEINRLHLLADGFTRLAPPRLPVKAADLSKRLRFVFVGEEGIDSGGVGKEAFMLLSRACARYLGGSYRCIARTLEDCRAEEPKMLQERASKKEDKAKKDSSEKKSDKAAMRMGNSSKNEEEEESCMLSVTSSDAEPTAAGTGGFFFHEGKEGNVADRNAARAKRLRQAETKLTDAPPANSNSTAAGSDMDGISDHTLLTLESVQAEDLSFFFGRLLGKAVVDRQLVDVRLSGMLLAHMVTGEEGGAGLSGADPASPDSTQALQCLKQLDPTLHRSLLWMQQNDCTDVIDSTFSVLVDTESGQSELALCVDGLSRPVTEQNKGEYIALIAQWKTKYAVQPLLTPFLRGFHELVPAAVLRANGLTALELGLLLSGRESVDIDDLRAYVVYQAQNNESDPWGEQHEQVVWFWQLCRDLSQTDMRSLLRFFTGSTRIPIDGFDPPLTVTQGSDMQADALPRAHTCFNQIVLPTYASYGVMQRKVLFAVQNSASFDFA